MDWYRIRHSIRMCMIGSAEARAEYIKNNKIFHHMGNNCMMMLRKIPLYPKLISIGDNVWVASNVTFVTHDVIHKMLNNMISSHDFEEKIGCINIKNNVFIGTNTTILPGVTIESNTIIAAGSLVNKNIPGNGVYGGVPVKYICSFDSYDKKRINQNHIMIKKQKSSLSKETVQQLWKQMNNSVFNSYEVSCKK